MIDQQTASKPRAAAGIPAPFLNPVSFPSALAEFVHLSSLQNFPKQIFEGKEPYSWHVFEDFLTPEGFAELHRSFPSLERFEKHEGLERGYGQRPHDRFYLAYEESAYHPAGYQGKGVIRRKELSPAWQQFLEELEDHPYQNFIRSVFGAAAVKLRYAWHVSTSASEVCPHLDDKTKVGLHNFYFNTAEDWEESWGGHTLVLGGLKRKTRSPDFSDFASVTAVPFLSNRSFFFINSPHAWHGVKSLVSPPGKYRRLFCMIFEVPENKKKNLLREFVRLFKGQKKYPGMR